MPNRVQVRPRIEKSKEHHQEKIQEQHQEKHQEKRREKHQENDHGKHQERNQGRHHERHHERYQVKHQEKHQGRHPGASAMQATAPPTTHTSSLHTQARPISSLHAHLHRRSTARRGGLAIPPSLSAVPLHPSLGYRLPAHARHLEAALGQHHHTLPHSTPCQSLMPTGTLPTLQSLSTTGRDLRLGLTALKRCQLCRASISRVPRPHALRPRTRYRTPWTIARLGYRCPQKNTTSSTIHLLYLPGKPTPTHREWRRPLSLPHPVSKICRSLRHDLEPPLRHLFVQEEAGQIASDHTPALTPAHSRLADPHTHSALTDHSHHVQEAQRATDTTIGTT
jgi:hypothetical protein